MTEILDSINLPPDCIKKGVKYKQSKYSPVLVGTGEYKKVGRALTKKEKQVQKDWAAETEKQAKSINKGRKREKAIRKEVQKYSKEPVRESKEHPRMVRAVSLFYLKSNIAPIFDGKSYDTKIIPAYTGLFCCNAGAKKLEIKIKSILNNQEAGFNAKVEEEEDLKRIRLELRN